MQITGAVNHSAKLRFVELDRFDKELEECGSMAEKWFYSMKHMGRMERLPEELRVQVFERLFEACEIARFTPEEKLEYEHDMMTERDYTNILNTYRAEALAEGEAKGFSDGKAKGRAEGFSAGEAKGLAEGEARGRAEGEAKGRKEEQLRIAKTMIEKGIDTMTIASVTGLTPKDIEKL